MNTKFFAAVLATAALLLLPTSVMAAACDTDITQASGKWGVVTTDGFIVQGNVQYELCGQTDVSNVDLELPSGSFDPLDTMSTTGSDDLAMELAFIATVTQNLGESFEAPANEFPFFEHLVLFSSTEGWSRIDGLVNQALAETTSDNASLLLVKPTAVASAVTFKVKDATLFIWITDASAI